MVGPDLLVVDDLQWVDPASREVVGLLVDRIAVVVGVREGDEGAAVALEPIRAGGATIVRLGGLGDTESLALARRLRPDAPEARLRRALERAGGNPLLIEELVARGDTSSSLARAIRGQVEDLPPDDREALELLALAHDRPTGELAVPRDFMADADLEEAMAQRNTDGSQLATIVGDPACARETVQRLHDIGVDELILVMQMGTVPHELIMESMRTFAEKVMPAFRDRWPDYANDGRFWCHPIADRAAPAPVTSGSARRAAGPRRRRTTGHRAR